MSELHFLRGNVAAKPTLNHWILWPALLPPPWASRVISKIHVPIMESYIAEPEVHAKACRSPALMGGPWMDYATPQIDEIRALLASTRTTQARSLELAAAIETLDKLLRAEAKGGSLEALYARIPEVLQGYVELVYDPNNYPAMRFLEGLMYRGPFYDRSLQQVALTTIEQDWRPYERSTPILDDESYVLLDMPFDDPRIDRLFALERTPRAAAEIMDELAIDGGARERFAALLTTEPPAQRHTAPAAGEVRIRYFGHACVLVETRDVKILVDPFVSYEYPTTLARYTLQDLPDRIDYVLLTHGHTDHARPETLLRLRSRIDHLVVPRAAGRRLQDPSLKLAFQNFGFRSVLELADLETIDVPGGALSAIPFLGEHGDMDVQAKTGYHVRLGGRSVMCLADSANLAPPLYRHIHELLGDLDVLFLGMECEGAPLSWHYGMLLTQKIDRAFDQSRREKGSDCAQGVALIEALRPKQAYIYAMGQEPWLNHVLAINQSGTHRGITESDQFVAHCRRIGIESERLYGMKQLRLSRI